jgi:hypothetical protein
MTVLDEIEFINVLLIEAREAQAGLERVRLGNFLDRFEKCSVIGEAEVFPRAAGAFGFDRGGPIAEPGATSRLSSQRRRKRGGTPSSNTSKTKIPLPVSIERASSCACALCLA